MLLNAWQPDVGKFPVSEFVENTVRTAMSRPKKIAEMNWMVAAWFVVIDRLQSEMGKLKVKAVGLGACKILFRPGKQTRESLRIGDKSLDTLPSQNLVLVSFASCTIRIYVLAYGL